MTNYSEYKPSGVEWLGEIPLTFEVITLKHLVKTKITDGPHETPVAVEEGIPFISAEAIQNLTINFESKWGYISKEAHYNYSKKCKPENGDVFIVKSGATTGKAAYVNTDIEFNIWSPLALVRANELKVKSRYLFYYVICTFFQEQIQFSWSFGTQQNIGMGVIQNLKIIVPPLSEQLSIVRFLDFKTGQIDRFIANRQKQIELLKEQKAAIINKAVTKGINPDAKMKPSGIEWIGEIPEGWEVWKLKFLTKKIGSGVTPLGGSQVYKKEGVAFFRSQNVYNDKFELSGISFIDEVTHKSMRNSKIEYGDVLLNITGASIGRCFYYSGEFQEANVNQHVCIIRANSRVSVHFLHSVLISEIGQNQIFSKQSGSNREGLNFEQLRNFSIPLPPPNEQFDIINIMRIETLKMDSLISKYQKQIDLMQEYRTSLISQAVTGKIDVRVWQKNEPHE